MAEAQVTFRFHFPSSPHSPGMMFYERGRSFEEAVKNHPPGATLVQKYWDKYVWPGAYPLYYMTKSGSCLCSDCANKEIELTLSDDEQWKIEQSDVNWENTSLYCDNCQNMIESAYGEGEENGLNNE